MFPFQKTGELSFQTMEFVAGDEDRNNAENQIIWSDADLSANMNSNPGFDHSNNSIRGGRGGRGRGRGRGRRSSAGAGTSNDCNDDNNDEQKKTIHREVERQRRLEMSNLYASLRSTLPLEYIQGKRSTSDHIAEAANYIKDLEKNVKDLTDKRDELKATSSASNYHVGGSSNNPRPRQGSVVIEPRLGGISIDIDVGYEDESFCLSSALQIAIEEGISVSRYTSTRVADRLIHSIVCEVNDLTCVDFNRLQWRLNDLVS
nr:hypothetical protein [Suaeda aralocaspica]